MFSQKTYFFFFGLSTLALSECCGSVGTLNNDPCHSVCGTGMCSEKALSGSSLYGCLNLKIGQSFKNDHMLDAKRNVSPWVLQ